MVKKLLIAVLLAMLAIPAAMSAQTGSVTGKVTDGSNGTELTGANVFIQQLQLGAVTDLEGNYSIPNVPAGTYQVSISFVGYQPIQTSVTVTRNLPAAIASAVCSSASATASTSPGRVFILRPVSRRT